jgi:hypothetical protein
MWISKAKQTIVSWTLGLALATILTAPAAALTLHLNWTFNTGPLAGSSGSGTATIDTSSLTNSGTESFPTNALLGLDVTVDGFAFLVDEPSDIGDLSVSAGFEFTDGTLSLLNIKSELPANLSLYFTSSDNQIVFSEVGSGIPGVSTGSLAVSEAMQATPVPLPAGWVLVLSGFGAFFALHRRQALSPA